VSPSIGPLGLLGVILIFLKVAEVIDWPWWLVTAPFWAGPAFVMSGFLAMLVAVAVVAVVVMILELRNK
jgi:hypothetical protein